MYEKKKFQARFGKRRRKTFIDLDYNVGNSLQSIKEK